MFLFGLKLELNQKIPTITIYLLGTIIIYLYFFLLLRNSKITFNT